MENGKMENQMVKEKHIMKMVNYGIMENGKIYYYLNGQLEYKRNTVSL